MGECVMLEFIIGIVVILMFIIGVHGAWLIVKDKEHEYWTEKRARRLHKKMQESIDDTSSNS
jgi:hypothetical protein